MPAEIRPYNGGMDEQRFISLDHLATALGLSRRFLRAAARDGRIPCLEVGGRLRFDESAVRAALARLAEARAAALKEGGR